MDDRYSVYENQLLYALTVALLASKNGDAMNDSAVKNCLESIEQHSLIGPLSDAFDMHFCQFTGYLYHYIDDKLTTIGTLRINCLGRARVAKLGGPVQHAINTTDRTVNYIERKERRRGVYRIDLTGALPC